MADDDKKKRRLSGAEMYPEAVVGQGRPAGESKRPTGEEMYPMPEAEPDAPARPDEITSTLEHTPLDEGSTAGDFFAGVGNLFDVNRAIIRGLGATGLISDQEVGDALSRLDFEERERRDRGYAFGAGELAGEVGATALASPVAGAAVRGLGATGAALSRAGATAARAAGQAASKLPTPIVAAGRQAVTRAAPAAQQVAKAARYVAPSAETTEAALLGAGEAALSEYGQEGAEGNVGAAAAGGAALAPLLPMAGRAGEALLNRTPARKLAKKLAQDLKLAGGAAGDLPKPTIAAGETYAQASERISPRLRKIIAEADDEGKSIVEQVAQSRKRMANRPAKYQRPLPRLKPQEMADVAEVIARRAAAAGKTPAKKMDYARMALGYPLRAAGKIPQPITRTAGALGGGRIGSAVGDLLPQQQPEPEPEPAYDIMMDEQATAIEDVPDDAHLTAFKQAVASPVLQGHEGLARELGDMLGSWTTGDVPDDDAIQSMSYRLSEVPGLDYAQIDPNRQEGEPDEY